MGCMDCDKHRQIDIFAIKDLCRANFNPYLRELFLKIPPIINARLLDIGCGTGVSSCEIARISQYNITAMDIDDVALDVFREKISGTAVESFINIMHGTFETAIDNQMTFDVVLAEGLFNIIGFENGLRKTCTVLKDGGFMLLHDDKTELESKRAMIESYGFNLCETLSLDETLWWEIYCVCLEKKIAGVDTCRLSKNEKRCLEQIRLDIELYYAAHQSFQSIFYLLEKRLR